MQKPNQPVLTNAGRQMLNDVAGSKGKITYTKAVMYGQDLSSMTIDQLRDLTTINDSKLETKIGVSDIKLETVTIIASFSNATVMQDTTYSSIGWYASTTVDSAEKLIAVIPYEKSQTLIAGSNGKATASTDIQLLIHSGDDVSVELRPIEEGLISEAELKNALTLLSSKGLLYLGDEITDTTYQADPKCLDKISNTSIKHIDLETNTYNIPFPDTNMDTLAFVKAGWLLTIADGDSKRFQLLLDTDDKNERNAVNSIFTRVWNGASGYGKWTRILNRETLFGELPSKLYLSSPNDDTNNIVGSSIRWSYDDNYISLNFPYLTNILSYGNNRYDKNVYEEILPGLYDSLFINHAKLMEILAPYGKVKSVNGTQPDADGNVTLDIKGDIDKEIDDKRPTSLNFGTVENGQTFVNISYPDNQFQLAKHNKSLYLDPVSFIDSLTYKDKMSDNLLVSHAQLIEALRDKADKEDINNALFVKTDSSTPVTLNPGITSTGKTLIYKSPTGNPSDDVYLATQNDLNQKADKSSVYSKSETYSKDEATKTFGKIKTVDGITPDSNGNVQLNAVDEYNLQQTMEIAGQHLVQKVNGIAPTTDGNGLLTLKAENIPNAVFGTSRSRKQLEINPSVTIGSDRKGYMIRDGSETFDLASSDDLENMLRIYTVHDLIEVPGLKDLNHTLSTINSYARSNIDTGIYLFIASTMIGNIKGIPQEVLGDKYTLIKIINVYKDNSKDVDQQFQEIKQYEDYGVNEYRRVLSVDINGQVKINSWYKFSGTKVD